GVDFDLHMGAVNVLVGENGAGKSTLMKVLAGVHQADEGTIMWRGEPVRFGGPREAQAAGISTIYQEFNLVPDLSVAENLFLGHEPTRGLGIVDFKRLHAQARPCLAELGLDLDPATPVRELGVAQWQMLEIARALTTNAAVITMDEPTAALSDREAEKLFSTVRALTERGVAIIYISHRMPELFALGHRVTVMRDGRTVGERVMSETTPDALIQLMVGRELQDLYPAAAEVAPGEELLRVEGLSRAGALSDVSFALRRGEIVGIAGLVGSGRTEVLRAVFGADRAEGTITVKGVTRRMQSPEDGVKAGIGFLTEDRKGQGLALGMTIRENTTMASLGRFSPLGLIRRQAERDEAATHIRALAIRTPSGEQTAGNLSGGNQQKVVLAKWLATQSEILFFDEPTRGIDVGARSEIYALMRELTRQGKGIVMVSSDLPEVIGMSDRILVMSHGRVVGEVPRAEATQESVLSLATRH
ncbi:MAG: sugar ABC transporter ATP-binding protein, partial [Candidatus Sericytochromatia bacterium]